MAALCEGERLRIDVLDALESRREVYVLRGRRALLDALLCSGTATADDVRDAVKLPPGINPKLFGAVPSALAKLGVIQQAGFVKTCRAVGHARPVAVWELADREAAVQWLADHPDTPAPGGVVAERQGILFPPENTTPAAGTVGAGG